MNKKERFHTAFNYLKDKGLIHTQKELADLMGASASNLSSAMKGVDTVLTDNFLKRFNRAAGSVFRESWLLNGDGSMLNEDQPPDDSQQQEFRLVPLINIDSVGGMHSPNAITDEPQYVETLIPFVGAYEGDICIQESGNSMSPSIPAGSVLLIRNVPNWAEYFGYGGVYVIELNDGRRITKEIRRSEVDPSSRVLCHSFNETVADEELPKSLIVSVWKVIKVLTNFGY